MSDSNEQKPAGYGHDQKGAAGGAVKNEGRVHVGHKAPMSGAADTAGESTAQTFTIDDHEIDIRTGETIFRAARRLGIKLPHLCYLPKPGYRADGNCRVCMVEIEGERVLAASCIRTPSPGMKVHTQTDRAKTARKMVTELLLTDQPAREVAHDPDSELWKVATRLELAQGRFPRRDTPGPDRSHPAMAVNLDACIHCNLCVRACREHPFAFDLDHADAAIAVGPVAGLGRIAQMRQLDAEPARRAENALAGADIDLAIVDRESLGGSLVTLAHSFWFVAIAHGADLALPMSQRLGQFIRKVL